MLACLLSGAVCGQTLENAARTLARKVMARIPESESPLVSVRSLGQPGAGESERVRFMFGKALPRATARAARTVEITLTISGNARERLLVAEFVRNGDRVVEMAAYRPESMLPVVRATIQKMLLWEQPEPILDVLTEGNRMLVLDSRSVTAYARQSAGWDRVGTRALDGIPPSRDLRGRLSGSTESFTAIFAGTTCRGTWTAALDMQCQTGESDFVPGRNTLEAPGWTPFFSMAALDDGSRKLFVVAGADGRTHVYDEERKALDVIDGWGSEVVSPATGCGAGRDILTSSAADRDSTDSLTAYEFPDRKPVRASESLDLPGPVLALWPSGNGALAVVRNLATTQYAAYTITLDCGH